MYICEVPFVAVTVAVIGAQVREVMRYWQSTIQDSGKTQLYTRMQH